MIVCSDYDNDEEFLCDLLRACQGDLCNLESIWVRMIGKMPVTYSEPGLAYLTLRKCFNKYDLSKKPKNRTARFWFAAFVKQRIRRALQTERQRLDYPMALSDRAHRESKKEGTLPTAGHAIPVNLTAEPEEVEYESEEGYYKEESNQKGYKGTR